MYHPSLLIRAKNRSADSVIFMSSSLLERLTVNHK